MMSAASNHKINPATPDRPIRVLCIDGGGIRGAACASFLKQLERDTGRPIRESFDMFAGTSVGGILVAAMVYGGLTAEQICDELMTTEVGMEMMPSTLADRFLSVAQTIPKFDGKGKRAVIDRYCGAGRRFCPQEWETERNGRLPFVLFTTYDLVRGRPRIHRNWEDGSDELVADVVDQTSAAPGFYPVVSSDTPVSGPQRGVDGALFANNPTDCAYAEALKIYGPGADIRVLSVGTGYAAETPVADASDNVGGIQWLSKNNLLSIIFDGPQEVVDMRMRAFTEAMDHEYVRVTGAVHNTSIDDVSGWNIKSLKATGEAWWYRDRAEVLHRMGFRDPGFSGAPAFSDLCADDIGSDYKPYFTTVGPPRERKSKVVEPKTDTSGFTAVEGPYTPMSAATSAHQTSFLGWLFGEW